MCFTPWVIARQGYYDGQIMQLTKRHQQRRKKRKGSDERAVLVEQRLPDPGAQLSCFTPSNFHVGLCLTQDAMMKHTAFNLQERP